MKKIIVCIIILILNQFSSQAQKLEVATINDSASNNSDSVVQIESEFPGGLAGWKKYLQRNLSADLNGKVIKIPEGQISAKISMMVSFIVDKEGNISDITVNNANDVPTKLVKELIRVIYESPQWLPAMQNGRKVISRKRQAITWQVDKE